MRIAAALVGTLLAVGLWGLRNAPEPPNSAASWSQWRGPDATGVSPDGTPPLTWDANTHIRFRTAIPGLGHSSPVLWKDRIFLTTAVPTGERLQPTEARGPGGHDNLPVTSRQQFQVLAVSAKSGEILWTTTVHETEPHRQGHHTASLASASPITDGERVYAFFGSNGLYALDLDGAVVWSRQLGTMETKHAHGEGASPVLHGDTLVLNWDHEGESWIAGLDATTGKERWWQGRDEPTSWATPVITTVAGRDLVIAPGTTAMRAYDLKTGDEVWAVSGLSHNIVASPVVGNGLVVAGSSYEKRSMLAVRLEGARGDLTGTDQIAWTRRQLTPYVPSILLYRDTAWFLGHYQRMLNRVRMVDGSDVGPPISLSPLDNIYASPVAADGRIYVTDLNGTTVVLEADTGRILATNPIGEPVSASAAIQGSSLYLRGHKHLYGIGVPPR